MKRNWYVIANGSQTGSVKCIYAEQDVWADTWIQYVGDVKPKAIIYLPMDGAWRPIEAHKSLVAKLDYRVQFAQIYGSCEWYERQEKAFRLLDFFDDHGEPK